MTHVAANENGVWRSARLRRTSPPSFSLKYCIAGWRPKAVAKSLISPGQPVKKLKANPTITLSLTGYSTEIEKMRQLPFIITEGATADIAASHALRGANGLFVNDSINLACAARRLSARPCRAGTEDVSPNSLFLRRQFRFPVPVEPFLQPFLLPGRRF